MKKPSASPLRTLSLAAALAVGGIAMVGCTTTPAGSEASGPSARAAMDKNVESTMARLYTTVPGSREMVQRSAGTLVFPAVVGGAFVVGAEYGRGALHEGGRTTGYYSTTAGSVGLQAGGQSKAVVGLQLQMRYLLPLFLDGEGIWTNDRTDVKRDPASATRP